MELYDPSLGDVATDHVVLRRGGARPATYEWWIHTELGVPVRAQVGGVVAELVWLEVEASSPPWPPLHSGEGEGRPGSL